MMRSVTSMEIARCWRKIALYLLGDQRIAAMNSLNSGCPSKDRPTSQLRRDSPLGKFPYCSPVNIIHTPPLPTLMPSSIA